MNTSGEVADLMAKEAIQMTESAVKLTALGVKNLAAIVMALANDDGKTEGVAKLKQMLKTGKQLCIMQIKEADLKKFNAEAKNYGIMYRPVADKTNDNGLCDVIAFQDDIPRLNYIMEKLGYSATEHEIEPEVPEQTKVTSDNTKDENSKNRPSRAERINENPHGSKSISFEDTAKTDSGIKPSVRKKIEDIKADLEEKKKPAPEKEKAIQHKQPKQKKRKKKNADFIVLNSTRNPGTTFRTDDNQITIISEEGKKEYEKKPKTEVARDIINELAHLL